VRTSGIIAALSGSAALVFENLWFRSASLALGNSVWSSAIVLSAFMAGLAVGSVIATWLEPRIVRPLLVYAGLEIGIGLSGLGVLLTLPYLSGLLGPLFASAGASAFAVNLIRLSVSFVLLVVPAACMGATLPVLVRVLAVSPNAFGGKLGWIYGANTVGAAAGVLACELLLVPTVGVVGAGLTAAGLNGVAAALAFAVAPAAPAPEGSTSRRSTPRRTMKLPNAARLRGRIPLLAAAFVCGAIFLGFEVATFRFFLLFFTALSTNFAVMLGVVLTGLAIGGFVAAWRIGREPNAAARLPAVASAAGAVLLLSYGLFSFTLGRALTLETTGAVIVSALAFVGPSAILSGLLFAVLGHALYHSGLRDIRAAGLLTAANTTGAMSGSLVTGLVLIERVGLERLFLCFAVAYGALALFLMTAVSGARETRRRPSSWLAAAAFFGGLLWFPSGQMDGVFLRFPINQLAEAGERRVALKEGQLETLQYLRADSLGRPDYYRLVTNNHSMSATDLRSRRYMRLFAHLPSILHPAPRAAALVGVGLGVTAKALTEDSRLQSIDVVDVSPDIPAMLSVVFPAARENPLLDARVRLHVEDARFFLGSRPERYDVITAEPPPPRYAGVANLYSREFFHLLAERLNPGGLATYWLPVHDLNAREARAIVAAFIDAFPETTLWTGSGLDWILMGLKPPGGGVREEDFRGWWRRSPVSDRLREVGLDAPESLGALFLADGPWLRAWVGEAPPLTDNFPRRISTHAMRTAADVEDFIALMSSTQRPANFVSSPLIGSLWPHELRLASVPAFRRQAIVDALLSLPVLRVDDLAALLGDGPSDPLVVKALFWRHYFDFDRADALIRAQPGLQGVGVAEYRAQLALMNGDPREAAEWLSRAMSPRARELSTIRAFCLLRGGPR
jgi:predicted membrane-bound spermidine synthase